MSIDAPMPEVTVRNDSGENAYLSIHPAQLRAARGYLNWTREKLGSVSGVSPETIKNIEHDTYTPSDATVKKILEALSKHGVEFFHISESQILGVLLVIAQDHHAPATNGGWA